MEWSSRLLGKCLCLLCFKWSIDLTSAELNKHINVMTLTFNICSIMLIWEFDYLVHYLDQQRTHIHYLYKTGLQMVWKRPIRVLRITWRSLLSKPGGAQNWWRKHSCQKSSAELSFNIHHCPFEFRKRKTQKRGVLFLQFLQTIAEIPLHSNSVLKQRETASTPLSKTQLLPEADLFCVP